ncbi:hypothetical protein IF650_02485 [Cellulosimicrobium terreum]|nr:hypothetical protein [Cellulosimicrobium terreum]
MSTRDQRVERLTRQRRDEGARKQAAALAAVDYLAATGKAITFSAVERAAGVSSWFVYNNAAVRSAIEAARVRVTPGPTAERVAPAGLRADLAMARAEVKQLREERNNLLAQVRRGLGSALESRDRDGLLEQVRDLERQRNALNSELLAARVDHAKAEEAVLLLRDDLDAARGAVRKMMRDSGRGTGE